MTITVTGVNDAPTAKAWTYSTDEETKLAISDLLSHAADLDTTDTVSISAVNTSGIQGTATWSGGVLTYTPAAAYQALPVGSSATETFTVTYVDTHGATVTQTMTIVVHGVNDPAWAEADQTATDEDTPVTTDVIANDGDIDNPAGLFVASAALEFPADGTLSISGGKITYTPSVDAMLPGQTRLIVVYYVLEDNGGYQVESTLTIEVTGLNDTPTALDPSLTTTESAPLAIGGPFVVAADPDAGEVLTLSGVTTVAAQGTLTLAGNELAYTPAAALETLRAGQTVTERFTVVVTDSRGATTTVPVTVTVVGENDPVIANPDTASTDEDTAVTTDVVANDTDLDTGDTKTITSATMSDPADGSVTVNGASLVFTPTLDRLAQGATHDVVITYVVVDSAGAESTSTLTITVTGINDAPVGADPVRVEVTGLDPVTIPQDLLNTADPEGGPVTVTGVETEPQHGTVTIVDGLPVYTPDPDLSSLGEGETVTDTFVIAVVDEFGTPGFLTIVVTITGVNDAPDAVDDSATAADNAATATVDVLANDTDPDTKDVLSITQASANQGAVKIVDGKLAHSFTPEEFLALPVGTPVTVTMTYSIDDGHGLTDTATVTLTYLRTIANDTDSDGNGIPDWWEVAFHGGSPGSSTLPVPGAVCRDPNDLLDLLSGTLKPGATVTVEGSRAWLPGSAVGYYVCSTPTLLDKVNATSDGRATATLTMPSTFDAGKHVLFGIGISSSGETLIQAIGFEVPPAPTVDGDDNGSGDDGGKGDDSSSGNHSGSGNDPDALPLTGVAFLPQIVLLAVMLIFVGFVTVGAANRRRQ